MEYLFKILHMQTLQLREKKNVIALFIMSVVVVLILVFAVSVTSSRNNSHGIIISEICTANESTLYDTNGKYGSDYVEIYNCSNENISLAGYGLSDNEEDPYRWTFPEMTLSPGECLILFGGTAEDIVAYYREGYVSPMMGFGFKYGEVCVLTNDKGECISRVGIPNLDPDTSLQVTKGDLRSYHTGVPSPGDILSESELNPPLKVITDNIPVASAESGFYDDEFYLTLSSENKDDIIYYTLDGSIPDESSEKYEGPILIKDRTSEKKIYSTIGDISLKEYNLRNENVDKCTVLKAVVVDRNGGTSKLLEKVYFVGFEGRYGIEGIPVMSISCDPADLFSYDKGIYVLGRVYEYARDKYDIVTDRDDLFYNANFKCEGKEWERKAEVVYWDEEHENCVDQMVGIRIHGGNTRVCNQKGFGLYSDIIYGDQYFRFDPFENGELYDRLVLRTGDDLYNSKIRDALVFSLISDRKAGTQEFKPCVLFLNGEYWGLYILQEKISKCSVSNNYNVNADNIYLMKVFDLIGEDQKTNDLLIDELYSSLNNIATNDMAPPEVYAHAQAFMDIQSFIDYCCIEAYIGNWDCWNNNTAFWRSKNYDSYNPYADLRWRMLIYDMDESQSLGDDETLYNYDSIGYLIRKIDVLQSLLQNQEFRRNFVISFMDIANNNFNYDKVHERLYDMADYYREPVVLSEKRWRGDFKEFYYDQDFDGNYDENEFDKNISIIDEFYKYRLGWITYYLKADLELQGDLVDVDVSVDEVLDCSLDINTVHFEEAPSEWSGKYFSDYPITLVCSPSGDDSEVVWFVNGVDYSEEQAIELDLNGLQEKVCIELKKR